MLDAGDPPLLDVAITEKSFARGSERRKVVEALHFKLRRGDVTSLVGPSGCGKTTALRIIMGLDDAYVGHVNPLPATLRLGVVFQDPRLLPWRTVEQNVRLAAPNLSAERLGTLLEELGLAEWRAHRPNQLSGGMARRVALARALAVEPDLLVLDEAFISLDERNAEMLRLVVFSAVERRGTTVLMVTHDIREAMQVSDVVLVLGPQPTHVLATIDLSTPKAERTPLWLETERQKIAVRNLGFLRAT